jgi:hypothetical protein
LHFETLNYNALKESNKIVIYSDRLCFLYATLPFKTDQLQTIWNFLFFIRNQYTVYVSPAPDRPRIVTRETKLRSLSPTETNIRLKRQGWPSKIVF